MKYRYFFLFCFFIFSLNAQQDSIRINKDLFALTADDIDRNRNLVESILNKKTTTAAQIEQFASEAPSTVYVVTKEQIRNRGYESLLDVLDDIPEVEIQRYGSPEFDQHITLRGVAGNEKFIVLQDGIRITAPTDDTHSIGYNFSVDNAEQVEVIIGPASALYGADAFSGIIQIITKKGEGNSNSIKTSYGRFGTTHNSFSYFKNGANFKLALSGSFYHSDEPDMPSFYPKEYAWHTDRYLPNGELLISPFFQQPTTVNTDDDRKFEMPTTAYYANLNLQFKDFELSYNRHADSYTTCGSTRPEYCVYSSDSKFSYFIETIFGRHTFRSRNLKWTLESIFSFHTYQLNNKTAFINTYTGYEPGYKMEFGKSKKWQERLRYDISRKTKLLAGVTYEILDDLPLTGDLPKPFSFDTPADLQNQHYLGSDVVDKDGNDLRIFQDFFYLHYSNFGGYAQLQSALSPSFNLTAGVRYDINTRYGESINPRLGLVWKPAQKLTLKMLYGESLLSPSPRKSDQHFGSFFPVTNADGEITGLASNFFHLSNSDLKPEKLRSVEGSIRYVLSNNLVFTVNGYYTRVNDLINKFAQDPELTSFKGVDVTFIETGQNEGNATVYGTTARLDAVYNLQNGLGLNFYAAYSFSDGESNGEQLLFNAKNNFKTGLELTHPKFSFSPRLYFRSTSFGSPRDGDGNFIGNDAFAVLNLFARFNVAQKEGWNFSVFTKINNVLDARYYNVFIGGAEGFANVPQRPRVWTMGGRLEFWINSFFEKTVSCQVIFFPIHSLLFPFHCTAIFHPTIPLYICIVIKRNGNPINQKQRN